MLWMINVAETKMQMLTVVIRFMTTVGIRKGQTKAGLMMEIKAAYEQAGEVHR